MKKGRNFFDPFISFDIAPEQRNASASEVLTASALPHRLGFLDCRLVIPGVTAGDFART
jgi:hypothetical protein